MRLGLFALLILLSATATAQAADDEVKLRAGTTLRGTVSGMTATEVSLDMAAGQKRQVPVNEIDAISFAAEPAEMKLVRGAIANGNYENAITTLDKIEAESGARPEIKQDMQFYKALCRSRMALAGNGDVKDAGRHMRAFVTSAANNYHYLHAAETLADLFAAIGDFDRAIEQYAAIERAPWPDYKMRGGVAKGRVLAAQKKYPEALAAFDAVLKLAGDASTPQAGEQKLAAELGKATCLAATGDPDTAIKLVQEVIDKAGPEDKEINGRAYVTLGNCYRQKQGAAKDALLAYLHVDLLYNKNREAHAEALANLAKLWNEIGKPERAAQATQLLKEAYANSVWAK
ncbi:MAG: tetratricopeptide repeat protein [Planctomycetia bacterium]|nr:tetratricopeptide repeat protein [Planctomycetia bacterium]